MNCTYKQCGKTATQIIVWDHLRPSGLLKTIVRDRCDKHAKRHLKAKWSEAGSARIGAAEVGQTL